MAAAVQLYPVKPLSCKVCNIALVINLFLDTFAARATILFHSNSCYRMIAKGGARVGAGDDLVVSAAG